MKLEVDRQRLLAEIEELATAKAILAWAPEGAAGGVPQNPWAEKTG